ncbi:MAG: hypothetical protein M8364_08145 [Methylobacter sp.]|uniref:hypothetical protein n=1 Tax=Methylobacter sp. TaxID=2051955 RepID=UPI00258C0CBA|nr:hypothetical protein [Methylobacter sp.]MCL7420857.1 hypothetical protein [Methylobacter sp.]
MMLEKPIKEKLWILVKAYPQPSQKYQETVCCAGITEDGRLLRLYPIRYRHLDKEQQFDRFDHVEMAIWKSHSDRDKRPESYKVDESSILILHKGKNANSESKYHLWSPFVSHSLESLKEEQIKTMKSLGIIKPDTNSLKFLAKPFKKESAEAQELAQSTYDQYSLLEQSLNPLAQPEYVFYFRFLSDGKSHEMQIHDWEVQATYISYKKKYKGEAEALKMMGKFYNQDLLNSNPHFIMGNMLRSPKQFMIIGVLRSKDTAQATLYDFTA